MGFSVGPNGATFTQPQIDPQTRSTFSATRSIAFAGDRIVIVSRLGMQKLEGSPNPATVYKLLSLDARTGKVRDTRDILAFASVPIFATNDAHVIVAARKIMRLTPDLKDDGSLEYAGRGHKFGSVENISPDGTTLGNGTSPGFELIDAHTLETTTFTNEPIVVTGVSSKAVVSDSPSWFKDYPKESSFVTLTDSEGQHLISHGNCGGRPSFLTNDLVLTSACKRMRILDSKGVVIREIGLESPASFAGVSQNGKRFALQLSHDTGSGSRITERFLVYSVESGDLVAELSPHIPAEGQSWTAFSPDGAEFVLGSPLQLTLYRLP